MTPKSFGIRREDKSIWERRTPIIPEDAKEFIEKHRVKIELQPSKTRIFSDEDYKKAGVTITEKPNSPLIVGIKEMPVDFFQPDRTYLFFSHVIKGQSYNMPMLKKIIDLNCTLIDYEKITDDKNRRLIAFGRYAGIAGMIDTLWALGKKWEKDGHRTPFLEIKPAREYGSINEYINHAKEISSRCSDNFFPEEISPVVIGFAGYGNVSGGAQEMLNAFSNVKDISPSELHNLKKDTKHIYRVVLKESDMVVRTDGSEFKLQDYYDNPSKYTSVFEKYLPHMSSLVNTIYWDERYPRLITKEWLKKNYNENYKLKVVGDISCDIHGSIECNEKATEPGDPVYVYNHSSDSLTMGTSVSGLAILAVDILPSEVPRDSSEYFSKKLCPFLLEILNAEFPDNFEKCTLPNHIKKAVIVYKGNLTGSYEYLKKHLNSF